MAKPSVVLPAAVAAIALTIWSAAHAAAQSPYVADQQRAIKALSAEEVDGYLEGRGMGLARAAELNGFPGPMHVLEHAAALELSDDQRARTQALFDRMRARAKAAGARVVDAERRLDQLFARGHADARSLRSAMRAIADAQAEARTAHLEAHLEQKAMLTPVQLARYRHVRGYDDTNAEHRRHQHR